MSSDITQSEGYLKAKAKAQQIMKEKEEQDMTEAENKKVALVTLDSLKSMSNIGMKGIDSEDIRPPMMLLVQGIKDKSELVDETGKQCPDGKFFLKGLNEIVDSVEASIVLVKKDHYKKEGNQWDGSRMYRAIAVRTSDMMPFSINFSKTSLNALSDLFTAKMSQGYPLFAFKVKIETALVTNKAGQQYWKSIVNVRGLEDDSERLGKLQQLAQQFDVRSDVVADDEETPSLNALQPSRGVESTEVEDVSDFVSDMDLEMENPL